MILRRPGSTPMPPKRLRFMGEDDETFERIGDELLDGLESRAGQSRNSSVLDIGCGYGRLAHAMKRRGFDGSYLGVDILRPQIRWCSRRLASKHFQFRHVDIGNGRYNPEGTEAVGDLDLGDRRFDVIAAFSVFTHMWPDDVTAYLRLAARHLNPGGHLQATFFLLDPQLHELVESGKVPRFFLHEHAPHCRFFDAEAPLHMVAYELDWVLGEVTEFGLEPLTPPRYGLWSHRPLDDLKPGYQDELNVRRPA